VRPSVHDPSDISDDRLISSSSSSH